MDGQRHGQLVHPTATIVVMGTDLLFFSARTWFRERLAANVGTVLVFGAFYLRFLAG